MPSALLAQAARRSYTRLRHHAATFFVSLCLSLLCAVQQALQESKLPGVTKLLPSCCPLPALFPPPPSSPLAACC